MTPQELEARVAELEARLPHYHNEKQCGVIQERMRAAESLAAKEQSMRIEIQKQALIYLAEKNAAEKAERESASWEEVAGKHAADAVKLAQENARLRSELAEANEWKEKMLAGKLPAPEKIVKYYVGLNAEVKRDAELWKQSAETHAAYAKKHAEGEKSALLELAELKDLIRCDKYDGSALAQMYLAQSENLRESPVFKTLESRAEAAEKALVEAKKTHDDQAIANAHLARKRDVWKSRADALEKALDRLLEVLPARSRFRAIIEEARKK